MRSSALFTFRKRPFQRYIQQLSPVERLQCAPFVQYNKKGREGEGGDEVFSVLPIITADFLSSQYPPSQLRCRTVDLDDLDMYRVYLPDFR